MIYRKSSSSPNKYLSPNCPIGGFFLNFFANFFFDRWSLQTSIFPKIAPVGDFFWTFLQIFFDRWSSPNKYLSKISANGSDFFEFSWKIFFHPDHLRTSIFPKKSRMVPFFWLFLIFFPAAWVCGESKSQNEEKRHLIIGNKRLTDLLMSKLHGNVCTRQR